MLALGIEELGIIGNYSGLEKGWGNGFSQGVLTVSLAS
jgi:hypothetical protein